MTGPILTAQPGADRDLLCACGEDWGTCTSSGGDLPCENPDETAAWLAEVDAAPEIYMQLGHLLYRPDGPERALATIRDLIDPPRLLPGDVPVWTEET